MKPNVLIVEDDQDIVELLLLYFDGQDFNVYTAFNGEEGLKIIRKQDISIALVDIMMPVMNGYEFIKEVRKIKNFPIIIISARTMDVDRITSLDLGADGYITKPFNPLEVLAYVNAMLRRYNYQIETQNKQDNHLILGELDFDLDKFRLKKNGIVVSLTVTELKILAKMMKEPERVFTKAQLYSCINGELYDNDDNTMMVHISNIRSKIEDDPTNPKYIKTIRGLGYKIENKT